MTVLFSDIRGFTTLSEGLTPTQLTSVLNRYLTPMTDLVQQNSGTIDKYMGDAVMAFWYAPLDTEEHTYKACKTALDMLDELEKLNAVFAAEGLPSIDIGIGVHVGDMSVGNMGSAQRFDYTVMGDNVNLGSRLEGLCKMYGVRIIVSEAVKIAIPHGFFLPLDRVAVKGKTEPVNVFELVALGSITDAQQAEIQLVERAFDAYYRRDFGKSQELFSQLKSHDVLASIYEERMAEFRKNGLPDDWNGVFVAQSK